MVFDANLSDVGGREIEVPIHPQLTDIARLMTEEEITSAVELTAAEFKEQVAGYCNGQRAKYQLGVFPSRDRNRIFLKDELIGKYGDFLPADYRKSLEKSLRRACSSIDSIRCPRYHALLFPQHRVAIMLHRGIYFESVKNGRKRLEKLGYTIVEQIKSNDSTNWNFDNRLEMLKAMRNPESTGVRAIDPRATQILDLLTANLSEEPLTYTFGVFAYSTTRAEEYPVVVFEKKVNPIKKSVEIPVQWRNNKLEEACKGLPLTRAIGLTSKVQTKNGIKHIPMVDFSSEYWREPKDVLKQLNMPGILVVSGHSYHFYGFNLIEEDQWKAYIESLKSPYGEGAINGVCEHWPDLQLKQGFSMLRITPCRTRLFQPCYMETFKPDITGTDSDRETEKRREPLVSIAA